MLTRSSRPTKQFARLGSMAEGDTNSTQVPEMPEYESATQLHRWSVYPGLGQDVVSDTAAWLLTVNGGVPREEVLGGEIIPTDKNLSGRNFNKPKARSHPSPFSRRWAFSLGSSLS